MHTNLARIHADFGIYDTSRLYRSDSQNIIHQLASVHELDCLHRFYMDYGSAYLDNWTERSHQVLNTPSTGGARSVDLPLIRDDTNSGVRSR